MWKTLNYLENILDNVDQRASQSLTKNEEIVNKETIEKKQIEIEKKLIEIQSDEKTSPQDVTQKNIEFLKASIVSLNEESQSLVIKNEKLNGKMKELLDENKKRDKYVVDLQERLESQVNTLLKEKMNIETQYNYTLEGKENQMRSVEGQLNETLVQLKNKDELFSKLRVERDTLSEEKQELEKQKTAQITSLKETLSTLQSKFEDERVQQSDKMQKIENRASLVLDEKLKMENELNEIQGQMRIQSDELRKHVIDVERLSEEIKTRQSELDTYKQRAQKVLQEKDHIIQDLRSMDSGKQPMPEITNDLENQELLRSEIEKCQQEIVELKMSIELSKRQSELENNSYKLKIKTLDQQIEKQKEMNGKLQESVAKIRSYYDDLIQKDKSEVLRLTDVIRVRDATISQLEKRCSDLSSIDQTNENAEQLRVLSARLMEKQSQLDTLKSEKSALQLQLEKESKRVKEIDFMSKLNVGPRQDHDFHDHYGDVESSIPIKSTNMFTDMSRSGLIGRRVAGVMNQLDRFGLGVARQLRGFPVLRILLLLYVAFIHIWVVFILYHSQG